MVSIRLDRAERNVINQIADGNHTVADLITATGFPRRRLVVYLDRLERDGFVLLDRDDGVAGDLWVELTLVGFRRSEQPETRHPLNYV